mmetsp:Transcript_19304/g.35712  ORF Transcript_19304/g.35712 Transcript_19304/m.35712 type:complete len:371 (+) Transcript_19304:72-1184(+)|eukprot:CAMPEP_0184560984 /NCGR_PEP_ID=MMETSP0199_2-20130426/47209_1 /TAXON_ID=1112570 /ORGANISM="Thraustochytrium sp., Strain LLF1b" /LENGTH=370 /DNA_ID=CAMNT_0026958293 /DNA_START=16 /DNA_END=1128 /DNA_ORIENTATION=+
MLWVDKHRPKSLDRLDYHAGLTQRLKSIAKTGDLPHLLFYGPSGAGKKTRVMALLREIFGSGVEKLKLEHRKFKTPTGRAIELTTLGSVYHIEMNPSDAGNNDRYVVQEVIKEIAQFHPVVARGENMFSQGEKNPASSSSSGEPTKAGGNFKVVFLSDCDSLTKDAQHGLRRTMERYVKTCRLILCCENLSKVIDPLRSRCLAIRVPAPTKEEICGILTNVAKKEGHTLSGEAAAANAVASGRNLRRALLMVEAQRVANSATEVQLPDYELYIQKLAGEMIKSQTPQTVLLARNYLYELLGNCVPPTVLLQTLLTALLPNLDDALKHEVIIQAAHYERRMQQGDKDIYHLEAFVVKFLMLYKQYVINMFC